MKSPKFTRYALLPLVGAASFAQGSVNRAPDAQSAQVSAQAATQIEHLMAQYHQAVVSHDGERLASMFVDRGSWFNVLSDAAYARARAKNPAALKVRPWSFQEFAKVVSSPRTTMDPRHSNVRILTDGTIASVYFNFVFLVDGKPENRGSETWQLVKGNDGWKIAAITYSSNP